MPFVRRVRDDKPSGVRDDKPSGVRDDKPSGGSRRPEPNDSPAGPSALADVTRGLGLLFRAARTAAKKLPTVDIEEAVVTSAREVGRAFENVAATLERTVRGPRSGPAAGDAAGDEAGPADDARRPPPHSPHENSRE